MHKTPTENRGCRNVAEALKSLFGCAALHVCLQDGNFVTVGEIVEQHMAAYEFAHEIVRRFDLRGTHGKRRNIVVVYQDPANKSQVGTGHSVRDQINEVLGECDLGAIDGSNDRIGGWQF